MDEKFEDSWLPDEADAVNIDEIPLKTPYSNSSRKPSDYNMYEPKTTGFSLGLSDGSNRNDDEVLNQNKPNYKNSKYGKPKTYQKKQYKKPEPRDFDVNPVDAEERARLLKRAEMTAVWHLARQDMTYKQVEDKLKKKQVFPPDVIQEMMDKCVSQRWIDDERYAENFVQSRSQNRKLGKNAIRMELLKKGVDRETIDNALTTVDREDEYENALELVQKQLPRTANMDKQKRTARLLGMLARKGYPSDIAYAVIREAIDAEIVDDEY